MYLLPLFIVYAIDFIILSLGLSYMCLGFIYTEGNDES
jgi:1,4-dihydroxy-2-naphthoate octaprenyltransferase